MNTESNEKKKEGKGTKRQDESPEARINELENENFSLRERIEYLEMQIKVL